MTRYVLDTNVYIGAIRSEAAREALAAWQRRMAPQLHLHAVVASELLVGAKDEGAYRRWRERWVEPAERVGRLVTPGYEAWSRAARIVVQLMDAGRLERGRVTPAFFHDCLIATSARADGFTVVTYNVADFRRIATVERGLRYAPPFP